MSELTRIKLLVEYDGADFAGWQLQPDVNTVQGELERAFFTIFRIPIRVNGSGRTDAGVHATGQVAHCDIPKSTDLYKLKGSVNGITSRSIVVKSIEEAPERFNARYDATGRSYRYYFSTQPTAVFRNFVWNIGRIPDLDYLNKISQTVLGEHNFESVSKTGSDVEDYRSIVFKSEWYYEKDLLIYEVSAIRFLRGMVRGLVGTFLEFEYEKRPIEDFLKLLESRNRKLAGKNAPAHGLILEEVRYD